MKYIKIHDGFAVDKKTAWIGSVTKEELTFRSLSWRLRVTIKENVKFFFKFGDKKETVTITCDTKEQALKEWDRVLKLINDNYET